MPCLLTFPKLPFAKCCGSISGSSFSFSWESGRFPHFMCGEVQRDSALGVGGGLGGVACMTSWRNEVTVDSHGAASLIYAAA